MKTWGEITYVEETYYVIYTADLGGWNIDLVSVNAKTSLDNPKIVNEL
ncbi:MAG: hypothetical protein ACM3NT_09535 [Methylocystaceae bacterium]